MAPRSPAKASTGIKSPHNKPNSSPPRKIKSSPTPKKIKKIGSDLTLTVTKFSYPLTCEMYIYSSKTVNDGYLNGIQVALAGVRSDGTVVDPVPILVEGNFHSCPYRRIPNTANEHALSGNGFWRMVILRYPPEGESTPETRQLGLTQLETFFKDPEHSRYPPVNITLSDETVEENLPSLDHYFFDDTIKEIMTEDLEENILNSTFYTEFNEFAKKCWAYPFVSAWGRSLGFPDQA